MQTLYPEYDQKQDRSHDWETEVHEKAGSVQCISQQASVMFTLKCTAEAATGQFNYFFFH